MAFNLDISEFGSRQCRAVMAGAEQPGEEAQAAPDDDVVDADFEEVKDADNKS